MSLLLLACQASAGQPATQPEPAPAQAHGQQGVEDPLAFVQAQYAAYMALADDPNNPLPNDDFALSPGLIHLIEADRREAGDMMPRLDFDYWIDGQGLFAAKEVAVTELPAPEGKRLIEAAFWNGRPQHVRFHFISEGGRWFLDDAEDVADVPEQRWRLREILTRPL